MTKKLRKKIINNSFESRPFSFDKILNEMQQKPQNSTIEKVGHVVAEGIVSRDSHTMASSVCLAGVSSGQAEGLEHFTRAVSRISEFILFSSVFLSAGAPMAPG